MPDIDRASVNKCILDFTANQEECHATFYYGFVAGGQDGGELKAIGRAILAVLAPVWQACLVDCGWVGGMRVYRPWDRWRGSTYVHWQQPATNQLTDPAPPSVSGFIRGLQFGAHAKCYKRWYVPIGNQQWLENGLLLGGPGVNAFTALAVALRSRITVPIGAASSIVQFPCVPCTTPSQGGTISNPRFISIDDTIVSTTPAQRRSRQLQGNFTINQPFVPASEGSPDFILVGEDGQPTFPAEIVVPLPPL